MSEDPNSVTSSVGKPLRMRPRPPLNTKDAPPPVPRSYTGSRGGVDSPVAEENAILVPSRVLSRPMSSRGSVRNTGVTAKSQIPFRVQWMTNNDDNVIQSLHTDTQKLHTLLQTVYTLLDEQSPGQSESINSQFFETEEEQMQYKMRGIGRVGALERYSTVTAQIEAAILKLSNIQNISGPKYEIAVVDSHTNIENLSEEHKRGASFIKLIQRFLTMYQALQKSNRQDTSNNDHVQDGYLLDIYIKLQKSEEVLRSLADEHGYNLLNIPLSLQSNVHTTSNILTRTQYITDLVQQAKDWTSKVLEYEQEENRKTVNELGQTIKVLRNELLDLKGNTSNPNVNSVTITNSSQDTVLKGRIVEQANEIELLKKELQSKKDPEVRNGNDQELVFLKQENLRLQGIIHQSKTVFAKELEVYKKQAEQRIGKLHCEFQQQQTENVQKDTLVCKQQEEQMLEDKRNQTLLEQIQMIHREEPTSPSVVGTDVQLKQVQKDLDLAQIRLDSEKSQFVKDVMVLRDELGELANKVQKLRAPSSSSNLVNDPVEDAAFLVEEAFRRQMAALQSASLRETTYLKEALQRKTYEHTKTTQLQQTEIQEQQRNNAQTLAKLRLATNKP